MLVCYTAFNVICAYIARMLLVRISQNFSSDSHVGVKLKLSYTACKLLSYIFSWSKNLAEMVGYIFYHNNLMMQGHRKQ